MYEKHIRRQLHNTNEEIKDFLDRKPIGRGRGNSKYKSYEKHKSKYRKFENIGNIVKPEKMKGVENLKIYNDIGKKLRINEKFNCSDYRRKVNPENTKPRQNLYR